jgi:flagellar hook-associated protein 2
MASSSSAITPSSSSGAIAFTGSSTYSADFQAVLNRAVDNASLPIAAAQTEVTTLQSQQSALTSLDTSFTTLQTDIENINSAVSGAPSAQISDTSAVTATTSAGALNGTYNLEVNETGSSTTTLSSAGLTTVTDPTTGNISSATSFTLAVNDSSYTITPSGTSLESLASAVNAAGDGVQATIVNVGSTSSPDYRLSLTSTELGADSIQLTAGSQPLLDTLSTGADAEYTLYSNTPNPTVIQTSSSQVTLAPGLTVNLLQKTTSPVTITVSTDYSGLQSALSTFTTDYNSAVTALSAQYGQNGGVLQGQSIVYSLSNVLNSISQYNSSSGSSSVESLNDLGLSINDSGVLSFDASTFSAANPADVQQFLGNTTSSGFLQAANNALTSVTDPNTGILQTADDSIQTDITNENNYISQEQVRISNLQTTLTQQLSAADAAIATLQAQNTYYQELFTAEYGNGTSSTSGG